MNVDMRTKVLVPRNKYINYNKEIFKNWSFEVDFERHVQTLREG
jgi:hypothetical protein